MFVKIERISAIAIVVCAAFACALLAGAGIEVEKVPNPRERDGSWVEDSGGILGREYIALINDVCQRLNSATSAEMAVVTVDNLAGMAIEDFAERLFRRFGIGQKGRDNGLLLLFSRDDRMVRLEVGYGLEAVVPDGLASRILDEEAVPRFREGEYGRGLYEAAATVARAVASDAGVALDIAAPTAWPSPIVPPMSRASDAGEEKSPGGRTSPGNAALLFAGGLLLYTLLGSGLVTLRTTTRKSRTAREKAAKGGGFFVATAWIGGFVGLIVLGNLFGKALLFILAYLAGSAAGTVALAKFGKGLKRRAAGFRAPCPSCQSPMLLLSEKEDDGFLTAEEIAEEIAGGMNFEIWSCPSCGASQRFEIKLGKARQCPRCKRRTLVSSTTTLVAATTSHGGKVRIEEHCKNPACKYEKISERSTARLSSSSSSGSGGSSSRSSGSSFGGGRSGGGGASKRW
jgi:uncharacterized protein